MVTFMYTVAVLPVSTTGGTDISGFNGQTVCVCVCVCVRGGGASLRAVAHYKVADK